MAEKRRSQASANSADSAAASPEAPAGELQRVDPVGELFALLDDESKNSNIQQLQEDAARRSLAVVVGKHPVASAYNVLLLHDEGSLIRSDADRIYRAIRELPEEKEILLILYSPGGEVEPAYLISQLCREYAKGRFVVAVPRRAKSAATLICCGADQVHMGPMSELGPIDPQIGNHPALGLGNALRHIAGIVQEFPQASLMFAQYMAQTVRAIDLGYYERVVESAAQYAERLLDTHANVLPRSPAEIAHTLVYEYKDHGFLIDRREAERIFGPTVIAHDTDEYRLANAVYEHLDLLRFLADFKGKRMYWVGSFTQGCHFYSPST